MLRRVPVAGCSVPAITAVSHTLYTGAVQMTLQFALSSWTAPVFRLAAVFSLLALAPVTAAAADAVLLTDNGMARAEIVVDPAIMADDLRIGAKAPFEERQAEKLRQRLRESVRDLSLYLEKISGAKIPIVEKPSGKGVVPVLVGSRGTAVFGGTPFGDRAGQGWRIVVDPGRGVGLLGQSPLGTSYAVYELLHRLGCRWYMPSELGEHIPPQQTIRLAKLDESGVPFTLYRGIWYGDEDFKRRIRQGGLLIHAGHALEGYVFAALVYWIFCFSMSRYSQNLERKLHTGHTR